MSFACELNNYSTQLLLKQAQKVIVIELQIAGNLLCPYRHQREREIHYVDWASKTYEDESVFTSETHLGWQ